jgi:hypothetical protein
MPIDPDPSGSSGTTVNVEVRDGGGGPPEGPVVDVAFSWDPAVMNLTGYTPASGEDDLSGSIIWRKVQVPNGGGSVCTAEFSFVGDNTEGRVLFAALAPEMDSRPTGTVLLPA